MTTREEREWARANKDEHDEKAREMGHVMTWRLGPDANRKGHNYHFVGECDNCGASMIVASSFTTCAGFRDARREACSGPGTKILTEIEHQRSLELLGEALADFVRDAGLD